jgi:hypothetical protein
LFTEIPLRISGLIGIVKKNAGNNRVFIGVFWSHGELGGIDNLEINDQPISGNNAVVQSWNYVGSNSQTVNPGLGGIDPEYVEEYPGFAYSVIELDLTHPDCPAIATVSAECIGIKVFDPRVSLELPTSNVALILYYLHTNPDIGLGIGTSAFDWSPGSSWRQGADHGGEDLGGSGLPEDQRYGYRDLMVERDPDRAFEMIGIHGFMSVIFSGDKYELMTLECRGPSGVRADLSQIKDYSMREIPVNTRTNQVIVQYIGVDGRDAAPEIEPFGGAPENALVSVPVSHPGIKYLGQATRWGTKKLAHAQLETHEFNFKMLEETYGDTIPGNVVEVTTPDGLIWLPMRVLSASFDGFGWVKISAVLYSDDTDSDAVTEDDIVTSYGATPGVAPPVPVSATESFAIAGVWEKESISGDPNDLTLWQKSNVDIAGDSSSTLLNVTAGQSAGYVFYGTGDPFSASILSFIVIRWDQNIDADTSVRFEWWHGLGGSRELIKSILITPTDDLIGAEYRWRQAIIIAPTIESEVFFQIQITIDQNGGTFTAGNEPRIEVKSQYTIPWAIGSIRGGYRSELRILRLFEWSWGNGVPGEVERLAILRENENAQELSSIDREENYAELQVFPRDRGLEDLGLFSVQTFGEVERWADLILRVYGTNGMVSDAVITSQEFADITEIPAELQLSEISYVMPDEHVGTSGSDASSWTVGAGTINVLTNVETAPDGTLTADKLTCTADGYIQNLNQYGPFGWEGEIAFVVWMKSANGELDIKIEDPLELNNSATWKAVRRHWRRFRIKAINDGKDTLAGPRIYMRDGDEIFVWGSGIDPIAASFWYQNIELSWVIEASWRSKMLKIQYRTADVGAVKTEWIDHGLPFGIERSGIEIGSGTLATLPEIPLGEIGFFEFRLYDWRIVSISRDNYERESSDPATVSLEIVEPPDTSVLRLSDVNDSTVAASRIFRRNSANLANEYVDLTAGLVATDTTDFDEHLSSADTNVQLALETLDAHNHPATITKEIPLTVHLGQPSSPTIGKWIDDGAGSIGIYLLWFSKNVENSIIFGIKLPPEYDPESDFSFVLTWVPGLAMIAADTVCFNLEYVVNNVGETSVNSTLASLLVTPGITPANTDIETTVATISGTGLNPGATISGRISRCANDPSDDYNSQVGIRSFACKMDVIWYL